MKITRIRILGAAGRAGLLALFISTALAAEPTRDRPVYQDAGAPIDARIDDLLSRLTLEEKIAQITTVWMQKTQLLGADGQFDPTLRAKLYPAGIGHFARPNDIRSIGSP